jgi:sugar lactone lactonase YvrE
MERYLRLVFAFSASACLLLATQTKTWIQNDYSDFEKGNLKRLSISSDGRLTLAPQFREVFDSASVYLWALAADSKGNLYAGGGGPGGPGARVYAIAPDGKGKTLAEFNDLEVHALAVDKQDRIYAATAPDGKVYRIAAAGKPETFFDPHAKYIWAMAFDSRGNLFVATGDRGEIYRVAPNGTGAVFYKTSQAHIRSLTVDPQDNLVVGTEPDGLVIRVSPEGKGFVLYQSPKREVTSVAVAKDGSIYAAAIGNKLPAAAPQVTAPAAPAVPSVPSIPGAQQQHSGIQIPGAPAAPLPAVAGGSEVYRIDKEGFPRKVWSDARDIAYSIAFDREGRPLVATGNGGDVYRLDSDLVFTSLVSAPPAQVTCLYVAPSGAIYAATGNIGKVYQIGPGLEKEGVIESDVFDAGLFSYWGRLSFVGDLNAGSVSIETRSGNLERPESDWSPWAPAATLPDGGRISSPPARFVQWRATLTASSAGNSPEVREVDLAYQARNVAPRIERIEFTPANYRFQNAPSLAPVSSQSITLPAMGRVSNISASSIITSDSGVATMQYAKGWAGARWSATDEDGDGMTYTVQIRGEKETEWKPLEEGLTEKRVSFDTTAFPDGAYRLRVIASDARSNPPEQALSGELTSALFVIDNTPPAISGLAASAEGGKLRVRFKAADVLNVVTKAEMSVNGGEWTVIQPTTRLSDSREEDYDVSVAKPAGTEQTIAVRVTDECDNQSVAKTVIR